MWGIHRIEVDERMTPRRGLILHYYAGKLEEISLILALTGRRKHLQLMDYDNILVRARKYYWVRLFWSRTSRRGLHLAAGIAVDPAWQASDIQFKILRDPSV